MDYIISKYEVMLGVFKAQDDEDTLMLSELSKIINAFCKEEVRTVSNVTRLSFDREKYKIAIDYLLDNIIEKEGIY